MSLAIGIIVLLVLLGLCGGGGAGTRLTGEPDVPFHGDEEGVD